MCKKKRSTIKGKKTQINTENIVKWNKYQETGYEDFSQRHKVFRGN